MSLNSLNICIQTIPYILMSVLQKMRDQTSENMCNTPKVATKADLFSENVRKHDAQDSNRVHKIKRHQFNKNGIQQFQSVAKISQKTTKVRDFVTEWLVIVTCH